MRAGEVNPRRKVIDDLATLTVEERTSADMLVECGELVCILILRSIVTRGKLTLPLVDLFTKAAKWGEYSAILEFFNTHVDVFRAIPPPSMPRR